MKLILKSAALAAAIVCAASPQEQVRPAARVPARIDSKSTGAEGKQPGRSAASGVRLQRRADGTVASASGLTTRHYAGTKQDAARAFVAESAQLLGGVPAASLKQMAVRTLRSRTYVRYQQEFNGIPIRGSQLVVQVSPDNRVEAFQSRLEPRARMRGEWKVDASEAEARAVEGMNPNGPAKTERILVPNKGELIPVWRVTFRSGNPAGDWEVLVNADNGAIVSKQDLRMGADALGYAFPRNPEKSGAEQVVLPNLVSDRFLTSEQTKIYTNFPALRGQVEPGMVVQGATRQDGHFLFGSDDARFSEVQLYWGMETAAEKFAQLGFWGFDEPLAGTVLWQDYDAEQKRFVGSDNAFFSPSAFDGRGGMFFYLTNRNGDTSLDTDVIFHEYGHAVVNSLVGPHQSKTFKALNEGTADYFSSSFLDDPVMAEYAAKIFNLRTRYLRRTDNRNRWPYNVVGEVHADGNIWSGALWDVRAQLGAAVSDEIAINAIAMLSPTAEFFDAASAAITVADELYGGQAAEVVAAAMEARGIFTRAAASAAEAIALDPMQVAEGSVSEASPGFVTLAPQQYRVEVPNRATRMTIRLQADAAVRFYIRYRVPVAIEDGYIVGEQVSAIGTDVSGSLTLENIPEVQAGTYYIAVVNTAEIPAHYAIQAETDAGEPTTMPSITGIEDGGSAEGSVPAGPFLASRQFAVQVPEGYRALAVRLEGDQDVDLYVRYAKPVRVNGSGYPEGDVVSESEYARDDVRVVAAEGGALPAGIYMIGVYNYSNETALFRVSVRLEQ